MLEKDEPLERTTLRGQFLTARDDHRNQNNGHVLLWVGLWALPE